MKSEKYLILIDCEDRLGLVANISRVLFDCGLNIISNDEYVNPDTGRFYMRTEVEGHVEEADLLAKIQSFTPVDGSIRLASKEPKKLVLMVTKESHCIGDLLIRAEAGEMHGRIEAVVGNHEHLRDLTERFGLPYHCVSAVGLSREEHEEKVKEVLATYSFDYLVLAKYMRILSPTFVESFAGKIINIHHSFLPSFIGANPYRQAHERGVKVIGATAHFVTDDLDEGPIIEQDTIRVAHRHSWQDMARNGRDVEKIVLARGLRNVLEDRVFVEGNRTIIFV